MYMIPNVLCLKQCGFVFFTRGFGFVTFQDPNAVNDVLNHAGPHVVDNKTVRLCL